jgi:hypothetical protein
VISTFEFLQLTSNFSIKSINLLSSGSYGFLIKSSTLSKKNRNVSSDFFICSIKVPKKYSSRLEKFRFKFCCSPSYILSSLSSYKSLSFIEIQPEESCSIRSISLRIKIVNSLILLPFKYMQPPSTIVLSWT